MSTSAINYLNIGLMLVASAIAFLLPFELFLFSYAVLGPLHYLTEIHWLHQRNYFTNAKSDYVLLVLLCVLLFLVMYVVTEYQSEAIRFIFLAFFSSLAMVLFKKNISKVIFIVFAFAATFILSKSPVYLVFFAVFLPTIIHVFIFTGAFILFGALKSKSFSGALSLVVFLICASGFFIFQPNISWYEISGFAKERYLQSGFEYVNTEMMKLLNFGITAKAEIFYSKHGLSVMRFIAFAYTYHYLNWFSKTSIIGWHKIPKRTLAILVGLWILSVGLYAYSYRVGLVGLYFLSMLHVFLEFPLNYRSFIGIGAETISLAGLKKALANSASEKQSNPKTQ